MKTLQAMMRVELALVVVEAKMITVRLGGKVRKNYDVLHGQNMVQDGELQALS